MCEVGKICETGLAIDCHLDLGMYVAEQRRKGRTHVIQQDFLDNMRKYGLNVVIAACYLNEDEVKNGAAETARKQIAALRQEVKECPDSIAICESYDDIIRAIEADKLAIIISFEGAEPIEGKEELLDEFYSLGVRCLGVSWSRNNFAAEGAPYTAGNDCPKGLSDIGKKIVKKAADIGYLIDVTHLNDPGMDDIIAMGIKPIIASHSNCRVLNPTPRNIDDIHCKAIAETGGVICLTQVSALVADDEEDITIERMVDHFDHAKALVGADHLGIGCDFCDFLYRDDPNTTVVVNSKTVKAYDLLKDYGGVVKLRQVMERRNYTPAEIKAIFGGNIMRVLRERF